MKNLLKSPVLLLLTLGLFSSLSMAQSTEANTVTIRVETKDNGRIKIMEKTIDTAGMSEEEKERLVEQTQNDMLKELKGDEENIQVEIAIEDKISNDDIIRMDRHEGPSRMEIYKKRRKGSDEENFEWNMERFGEQMKQFGEEFPQHIEREMPQVYAWSDNFFRQLAPSTIRSLDVFPNKPQQDVINVRFFAPEEGDVTITLLDVKGNTVAQETEKAFKGEYVGQLQLKKSVKGTFFVLVSQGEDAQSRKIILE